MQHIRKKGGGFSLLEVMVSVVIVSLALLGLAGMSIRSLAANDSSGNRAAAALQAMQISDLLRANRQLVVDNKFNVAFGGGTLSDTRANSVLAAWRTSLSKLPAGDGSIAYTALSDTVLVTVQWDDRRGNQSASETATTQTYAYAFRP
jgi:type IV pilus assembly protein PilV